LDWHVSHYVRVELDKLFGYSNFLNEIAWCYSVGGKSRDRWARKHDTLLFYTRGGSKWFFDGKAAGVTRKTGKESQGGIIKKDDEGRLYQDKLVKATGKYYRYYLDEPKLPEDWWTDINSIQSQSAERIGYPTQKPEALIERVIRASCRPGGVVADFFSGGGTTPAVAQRLGRRWIACDISRVAVSITADRIAKVVETQQDDAKPKQARAAIPDFMVSHWGIYEIDGLAKMREDAFRGFVLAAYEAREDTTDGCIHGYKGKEPIFVGPPDPDLAVRKDQIAEFANAVLKRRGSGGTGTMIAWAFTDAARKMSERIAAQQKLNLTFVKLRLIPIESPDFAAHVTSKDERYSDLFAFVLPPTARVRSEQRGPRKYFFDASESVALNSGAEIVNVQWDFEYRDYFTSTAGFEYQRTKKGEPVLSAEYEFPQAGKQRIAVRVQDDLGGERVHSLDFTVS
jgi:DNA modification methylase